MKSMLTVVFLYCGKKEELGYLDGKPSYKTATLFVLR